ncbi:hypothetical protein KUM39_20180 [Streptomyces sp. J2-1]|uniref:hypothetical protein n=1 Tax=Streptomyces corallincola TaxID=2851888 RepID=UPI001C386C45|nr:hypothetical protein [Streptomyces corallincola]MBV2356667.1 hypothetical protein [Streptomyces corallincola]
MRATRRTTTRGAVLAAALAALLTLAGCGASTAPAPDGKADGKADGTAGGGGAGRFDPLAALRTAAHSTDRAESARVRSTTSMGDLMSMTAEGTLAWDHGIRGDLTLTYTGGRLADTLRAAGTATMRARYLPDAYYVRMSDDFARRAGGRHWVRYSYKALAAAGGSGAYVSDQMRDSSPNQSVKLLLASGDVREMGTERVAGTRTTHYAGTVRVSDLAARTGRGLTAAQLAELKQQLRRSGIGTERIDLWVDGRNLLVKKTERADVTEGPATGTFTTTAVYTDYGVRTTTEAPPPADTTDFTDLMKTGGGVSGTS